MNFRVLVDLKRIVAYICPFCSNMSSKSLSIFNFSGKDKVQLICPTHGCHETCVTIAEKHDKYKFDIECPICGDNHSYTTTKENFWNKPLLTYKCPVAGIDVFFAGEKDLVENMLNENTDMFSDILDEFDDDDDYDGRKGAEEVNPHMNKVMKILMIVVALIIAFILIFAVGKAAGIFKSIGSGTTTEDSSDKDTVKVPDIVGKTEEEATKAKSAAEALFAGGVDMSNVPTVTVSAESFGKTVLDVIAETKIVPSKAEGRRLIQQGGLSINGEKVTEVARLFTEEDIQDGAALIKRGKKNYTKIVVE